MTRSYKFTIGSGGYINNGVAVRCYGLTSVLVTGTGVPIDTTFSIDVYPDCDTEHLEAYIQDKLCLSKDSSLVDNIVGVIQIFLEGIRIGKNLSTSSNHSS